jgi:hypothetical protein
LIVKRYTKNDWFGAASTCDNWTRDFRQVHEDGGACPKESDFYDLYDLYQRPYFDLLDEARTILSSRSLTVQNLIEREYLAIQIGLEKAGLA